MSFRGRLFLAFVVVILIPMIAFTLMVRNEVGDRLTAQYQGQVESLVSVIGGDLERQGAAIGRTLSALEGSLVDDNRFRRAAVDGIASERRYLLDYAGEAMPLAGLSMLQIQDEDGRILSSGHFRNEFDRLEPELPDLLPATPDGVALVQARTPESPFVALARARSFRMGGERFTIVAGISVGGAFLDRLARDSDVAVSLSYPGGVLSSGREENGGDVSATASVVVAELNVPFIDTERAAVVPAVIRVSHPLTELQALRRSIDLWFLLAVAGTGLAAIFLASWFSSRMSRPLAELAKKTSRIDLNRLDIDFSSRRKDEIGALSRLLGAMTDRLRVSAGRIKEAERRATLGELARQVNHDIKNGLIPIRNVFRHLVQTGKDEPARLPGVLNERRKTIDSSIDYLEDLASNYARLSPRFDRRPCDVNAVAGQVVSDASGTGQANLRFAPSDGDAIVFSDPVVLRRILENLVDNAIDSLGSRQGSVTVSTQRVEDGDAGSVRVTVADTGTGMAEEEVAKIFDDFYTTKEDGTGLGLSIVRRLVMDLNGSVKVESEPGRGSRFIVDLPACDAAP
jgi:signal transduction histidine kinase